MRVPVLFVEPLVTFSFIKLSQCSITTDKLSPTTGLWHCGCTILRTFATLIFWKCP